MKFAKLLSVILLISLFVAACGGDDADTNSGGQSLEGAREENIQPTDTPAPTEETAVVEVTEDEATTVPQITNQWDLEDIVVYTTDRTLYVWDFAQHEAPQAIAYDVDESNVSYVPAKNSLLFGAWDDSHFWVNLLSLETYEVQSLIDIGRSFAPGREVGWYVQSWSPDGNWFVMSSWDFDLPLGIVAADGSGYLIRLEDNIFNSMWTTDNELILAVNDPTTMGYSEIPTIPKLQEIVKLDPATDGRVDITDQIDIEHINSATDYSDQFNFFYQELADSGIEMPYALRSTSEDEEEEPEDFYFIKMPEGLYENFGPNSTPVYCREWQIVKWNPANGSPYGDDADMRFGEILYLDEEAAILSNLKTLSDGSVVFLRIYYPNCDYGTPMGELIHLKPDGDMTIISDKLAHAGDSSAFQGWLRGSTSRFVVAPDETHVLWLESDGIGLNNTLYLTDLASLKTEPLKVDGQLIEGIVSLFWFDKDMGDSLVIAEED